MGRRIKIGSFGPLRNLNIPLNRNLYVIIGQQAVGKSTLSKVIYFCRKVRDYLSDYAREILRDNVDSDYYYGFWKFLRTPFMGCVGTTKHMGEIEIQYYYDDTAGAEQYLTITLDETGYVRFNFDSALKNEIWHLIDEVLAWRKRLSSQSPESLIDTYQEQQGFLSLFARECCKVFKDDERLLYIPAGRNLLAVIPDWIGSRFGSARITVEGVDIRQVDLVTQEFTEHIRHIRSRFGERLEDIVVRYLKTVKGQIPNRDVELAQQLIRQILKGDYVLDREGEKLYYEENKWVKLMFASSGQQEILWALNSIFLLILQREPAFLIFEEPESHLFPDSQVDIAKLIALLINSNGSEVFVTTHSPYMLTAFNLLAYSGQLEKGERNSVVKKQFQIRPGAMAAYHNKSSQERMVNLMEKDGLINALAIDDISDIISDQMDKIQDAALSREGLT